MMGSQAHKNEKPTLLGSSNKPVVLNSSKLIHSLHQTKAMKGKSPCLTRTRAKENGHWLLKYNRFMSHTEILALMGASIFHPMWWLQINSVLWLEMPCQFHSFKESLKQS